MSPKASAAEGGHDGAARAGRLAGPGVEVVEVGVGDRPELLQVVGGVELVLVERRLADDGVEEVAALGQAAGGRDRAVALGIDQRVAVRRRD